MKKKLHRLFIAVFGSEFTDLRTGDPLGKLVVFSLFGKVYVISELDESPFYPVLVPSGTMSNAMIKLGFRSHPPVNYERIRK